MNLPGLKAGVSNRSCHNSKTELWRIGLHSTSPSDWFRSGRPFIPGLESPGFSGQEYKSEIREFAVIIQSACNAFVPTRKFVFCILIPFIVVAAASIYFWLKQAVELTKPVEPELVSETKNTDKFSFKYAPAGTNDDNSPMALLRMYGENQLVDQDKPARPVRKACRFLQKERVEKRRSVFQEGHANNKKDISSFDIMEKVAEKD